MEPDVIEINLPEAVAELTAAFEAYERAIVTGDFQTVIRLFWDSPHTLRYGTTVQEHFYNNADITRFRVERGALLQPRTLRNTRITTFGRDYGTTNTEYFRDGSDKVGRQSQTWVRFPEGWRIVSAHVSFAA